ncbi:hypothetical protein [Noviherbaspirillum denitrificans]|uniref:hypothetical protein n=1 Tax=Noviherbaspirillum denitrificans TaxID=1968433 RepID=UPI001130F414|nr:hypothetical protein [Noviherbaspirillum denitrificans]
MAGIHAIEFDGDDSWRNASGSAIAGSPFSDDTPFFSNAARNLWEQEYKRSYENARSVDAIDQFIRRFARNDPDGLIPKLRDRLRTISGAAGDKERGKEDSKSVVALRIKEIGADICNNHRGTSKAVTGSALGEPVYGQSREGVIAIIGNTEGVSADRIQIRVNRIRFVDEGNFTSLDLGSTDYNGKRLVPGTVFWDSAKNWSTCGT